MKNKVFFCVLFLLPVLAVYAGETQTGANAFLKMVKAKGFSDANIRKMQVVLGFGD